MSRSDRGVANSIALFLIKYINPFPADCADIRRKIFVKIRFIRLNCVPFREITTERSELSKAKSEDYRINDLKPETFHLVQGTAFRSSEIKILHITFQTINFMNFQLFK